MRIDTFCGCLLSFSRWVTIPNVYRSEREYQPFRILVYFSFKDSSYPQKKTLRAYLDLLFRLSFSPFTTDKNSSKEEECHPFFLFFLDSVFRV